MKEAASVFKKYKPLFTDTFQFKPERSQDYAKHFDQSVEYVNEEVGRQRRIQSFLADMFSSSSKSVGLKLQDLSNLVGRKTCLVGSQVCHS